MRKIDLLGCLIGDSYISPKGVLITRHSLKQKEYLEFKYSFCKHLYPGRNFKIFEVKTQNAYQFSLSDSTLFRNWRNFYYPNGVKTISKIWLERLTKQGVAFWFCDDGSTSFKRKNGKVTSIECSISTCCSEYESELVIDYFQNKWNISMSKKRDSGKFSVRFGTKVGRKFVEEFEEFIPNCMKYKTDKLVNFSGSYFKD